MLAIMGKVEAEQKIADNGGELMSVLDLLRQKEGFFPQGSKSRKREPPRTRKK
jgi:hypothetical protein